MALSTHGALQPLRNMDAFLLLNSRFLSTKTSAAQTKLCFVWKSAEHFLAISDVANDCMPHKNACVLSFTKQMLANSMIINDNYHAV